MEYIYPVTSLFMLACRQVPVLLCQQKLHGSASILQEGECEEGRVPCISLVILCEGLWLVEDCNGT